MIYLMTSPEVRPVRVTRQFLPSMATRVEKFHKGGTLFFF